MEDGRGSSEEGCVFQALVAEGEADQFKTAVFRYLELHAKPDDDRTAFIVSSPEPGFRRQTATFWSAEAARDFGAYWRRLRAVALSPRAMGRAPG
jgi:hypothetical protein